MSKWKLRKPAMYENIPGGGYMPKAGVALPIALLLYVIASMIGSIPTTVQAIAFFVPRVQEGQNPFDLIGELLSDPAIILVALFMTGLAILVTIFYVRRIEKRPLKTIGLSRGRIIRRYIAGFGIGVALVGLTSLPVLLTETVSWKGFTPVVALYLAAFVIQGASEEVLFRGFLLSAISRRTGIFTAAMLSSVLFAAMHFLTIQGLLDLLVIFAIGFLLSMITVRTNSLWAACGVHSAWNFVSGLLFTVNAGGMNVDYSVITVGDPGAPVQEYGFFGDPTYLMVIALFAAVIAVVVFAGRNKLAVRRPESERVLAIARRFAKKTLPEAYLAYAERIAAMVETDDAKSAALLCLVMEQGVSPHALAEAGVGREAGLAALALARRPGEDSEERRERVLADPVAQAVWQAQEQYAVWQAQQQAQWQAQQYAQWQAQTQARYMSPAQAQWQARQDAEMASYVQRYADTVKRPPDGGGTMGE